MKARLEPCGGVYAITCKDNGRVYYGSATNMCARVAQHFSLLKSGKHTNIDLQKDWVLYGAEAFDSHVVVKNCNRSIRFNIEKSTIDAHAQGRLLYNVTRKVTLQRKKTLRRTGRYAGKGHKGKAAVFLVPKLSNGSKKRASAETSLLVQLSSKSSTKISSNARRPR